ncbi:MFS transporter [Streptomyces sp. NPDC006368]|uniref:MFS transporter n=1 Tax=Streptomyces sp. NPDC006368 TaxID=3156760 RepID=UPI0033AD4B00
MTTDTKNSPPAGLTSRAAGPVTGPARGRWIEHWEPGDPAFWHGTGRRVARRNLVWSIASEHLGFTIWTLWSVVAVELGDRHFTADQLFWLVALPSLVGAALRVPYTFAPARFGGRNWTVVSTLLLLVPAVLLALAVDDPDAPYWFFLLCAATAGLGGGNFASSMANITHFYPDSKQGVALGLNAAGGNIGVSSVQLVVPLVIATLGVAAAGLFWVPLILLCATGALLRMDNLRGAASHPAEQLRVVKVPQTWIVALLYVGTFGSFVGYATALPLLLTLEFPQSAALHHTFLGALAGSCARPLGGMLADRWGGARVTHLNFTVMAAAAVGAWASIAAHRQPAFLLCFLLLFVTAGIGNGSTYHMVPVIFRIRALRAAGHGTSADHRSALAAGRRSAAAALGIISAIGALGGFLINRAFGYSVGATGDAGAAMLTFTGFYVLCAAVTWWCYARSGSAVARARRAADVKESASARESASATESSSATEPARAQEPAGADV